MASADYNNSSVEVQSDGMGVETLVGTSEPGNFAVTMIYLVLLCTTTMVGNIGNTMVIGAVFCDKRLRKESNIFIVNLAIADLCVTGENGSLSRCCLLVFIFCCIFFRQNPIGSPAKETSYILQARWNVAAAVDNVTVRILQVVQYLQYL